MSAKPPELWRLRLFYYPTVKSRKNTNETDMLVPVESVDDIRQILRETQKDALAECPEASKKKLIAHAVRLE